MEQNKFFAKNPEYSKLILFILSVIAAISYLISKNQVILSALLFVTSGLIYLYVFLSSKNKPLAIIDDDTIVFTQIGIKIPWEGINNIYVDRNEKMIFTIKDVGQSTIPLKRFRDKQNFIDTVIKQQTKYGIKIQIEPEILTTHSGG